MSVSHRGHKRKSNGETPYQVPSPMYCRGCAKPCRTKTSLDSHQKVCPQLKLGKHDSFFKLDPLRKGHPSPSVPDALQSLMSSQLTEKILPLSQPLSSPIENVSPPMNVDCSEVVDRETVPSKLSSAQQTRRTMENMIPSSKNDVHSVATGSGTTHIDPDSADDPNCAICRVEVVEGVDGVCCDRCKVWSHRECLYMSAEDYRSLPPTWYCVTCLSIMSNKIKWGSMEGEDNIKKAITSIYNEIISWRKNLFLVPRGKVGTEFIRELTSTINQFTLPSKWTRVALAKVHIFIPMMLQKPSSKSKAKDHTQYLDKRLKLWKAGNLNAIMAENREIQNKLRRDQEKKQDNKEKNFCRLMLIGKVSQAMKFINNDDDTRGVHSLSGEIKTILEEKHPKSREVNQDILLPQSANEPEPVIFEEISGLSVFNAAKQIQGSGGPTLIDADGWKHMLCSRAYGNASLELCDAIADLAKKLCRDDIHPDNLHELVANRLIPLDKGEDKAGNPGVRPIGIGEILRRIIGKVVVGNIKENIVSAAGPLQTCAGLKSGIEASIHAMRQIFENEGTEALLLVDAENAFNNLNRKAALHNIKELCPPFHRYLANTYQLPAKMVINDQVKTDSILSEEGSTQGDVAAMAMYAIGIRPLINTLQEETDQAECQQVWYADDSSAAGKLLEMKKWWDILNRKGPMFGYFPKPSKTVLIIKNIEDLDTAREIFGDTGVKITITGERHLGAVIGSEDFRAEYVNSKIESWIQDVEQLSEIAKNEPQLAYSAYTKALSMRWGFLQRTIPNTKEFFAPLEESIRTKLIPAIIGRNVTEIERSIFSLPVRLGGLGIQNPCETADREYDNSTRITRNLTRLIVNQEKDLTNYDAAKMKSLISKMKSEKEEFFISKLDELQPAMSRTLKRYVEMACEKGAGVWLTALPLQSTGYVMNKQEFRDAICVRYGWSVPNTPAYCGCGEKNNLDHTLNCKLGGYVTMRHNNIRDLEASLLKEVCKDVRIEPEILPIGRNESNSTDSNNTAQKARLDVSAVGIWSSMERTFLDVRVMHPNSPSYADKTPEQLYAHHEQVKKKAYNHRIMHVDKGSFTPLIFSTTGGMGPEATKYHKRLAELIADKRGEKYPDVVNHIRTKLRFSLLKSILIALHGIRGRRKRGAEAPISDLSLNLIPERHTYEV